jgi:hypothetical protein
MIGIFLTTLAGTGWFFAVPEPKISGASTTNDVNQIRHLVSRNKEWVLALTPSLLRFADVARRLNFAISTIEAISGTNGAGGRACVQGRDRFNRHHAFVYEFVCWDTNQWELVRTRETSK